MTQDQGTLDLTGRMLVAMPGMGDPRFDQSVIFVCAHSEDGAMGLIVNRPAEGMVLSDLLSQLDLTPSPGLRDETVRYGGPVEHGRGFVLHSPDYTSSISTLEVSPDFSMTATLDILEEIAAGTGPEKSVLVLGYAGWGPGQVEDEMLANGWLVCDASSELVFDLPDARKWEAALNSLGIDPLLLSDAAGHA